MNRYLLSAVTWLQLLIAGSYCLQAQTKSFSEGPHRIEITLEKKDADRWRSVTPSLIFEQNDLVRFRIRANFDGYLYVMNHATSGIYTLLFPQDRSENENRIRANAEYLIPGTDAQFRIAGPPGHEIIYWLISPVQLGGTRTTKQSGLLAPLPLPKTSEPIRQLLPRCNDEIFRARGECVDLSAGPALVSRNSALPDSLSEHFTAASRDLLFTPEKNSVVISSVVPLTGPVIYEFRLAHR